MSDIEQIIDDEAPAIEAIEVEEIVLREERAGFCLCTYGGDN